MRAADRHILAVRADKKVGERSGAVARRCSTLVVLLPRVLVPEVGAVGEVMVSLHVEAERRAEATLAGSGRQVAKAGMPLSHQLKRDRRDSNGCFLSGETQGDALGRSRHMGHYVGGIAGQGELVGNGAHLPWDAGADRVFFVDMERQPPRQE